MAKKNNKPEDKQLNEVLPTSIIVPKYPFDENRTESDVISWQTMMHIAWLWDCAPAQVKKQQSCISRYQETWRPDDFGMACLKAKVRQVLVSSGLYTLDELKKLTIHEIIYLVDKQLVKTDYKEREQIQEQWQKEFREAHNTAFKHKEYWRKRAREAIDLVRKWHDNYCVSETGRTPFPYMNGNNPRLPDSEDVLWMYLVLGMKLQEVYGLRYVFIPDDVEIEMVSLFKYIEKPVWGIVHGAGSLEDFKTYWGYVEQDIAYLTDEKPAQPEQKATPGKWQRFVTCAKKVIEKAWQIFTRSFWEALLDKMFPK